MRIMNPCKTMTVNGKKVAVNFDRTWMQVDPRVDNDQLVTTCILRPLDGPKEIFTGLAVLTPRELANEVLGQKIALGRALYQYMNSDRFDGQFTSQKTAYSIARGYFNETMKIRVIETAVAEVVQ